MIERESSYYVYQKSMNRNPRFSVVKESFIWVYLKIAEPIRKNIYRVQIMQKVLTNWISVFVHHFKKLVRISNSNIVLNCV